jgi:hypothetical protein
LVIWHKFRLANSIDRIEVISRRITQSEFKGKQKILGIMSRKSSIHTRGEKKKKNYGETQLKFSAAPKACLDSFISPEATDSRDSFWVKMQVGVRGGQVLNEVCGFS